MGVIVIKKLEKNGKVYKVFESITGREQVYPGFTQLIIGINEPTTALTWPTHLIESKNINMIQGYNIVRD